MSEKIVQLNEEVIKGQLKELVRGSVEEIPYRLCCLETACPEFRDRRKFCVIDVPRQYENLRLSQE